MPGEWLDGAVAGMHRKSLEAADQLKDDSCSKHSDKDDDDDDLKRDSGSSKASDCNTPRPRSAHDKEVCYIVLD